jgi:hypothetical protein
MRIVLAILVALLLPWPAAWAQDPCDAGRTCVVEDLQAASDTQGASAERWVLPGGALGEAELERAFQEVTRSGRGVMGFFGLLADGQARSLSGEVVRAMFARYGVRLDFLPLDALERVESAGGKVTFHFDFGSEGHRDIQLPDTRQKVLESRHRSDPWLVDRKNRVREEKSGGSKLRLKPSLELSVDASGLTGVREGDLAVHHWLAGWVNLDLHSERHEGRVATGEKDRPVLVTDSRGEPAVVDGHYVPQRFDDWVVITAAGRRIEVGIPALSTN